MENIFFQHYYFDIVNILLYTQKKSLDGCQGFLFFLKIDFIFLEMQLYKL